MKAMANEKPRSFSLNTTISCLPQPASFLSRRQMRRTSFKRLYFKLVDCELPPDVWEDPKGYLYRTVVNTCFNWKSARKSRKEQQGVEKLEIGEPRSGHAHENAANQVEHLLGSLDEDIVEIVMLHVDSGYSDAEIAAMVGGSRSKISMILTRAREKLRKIRRGPDAKEKEKYAGT